MNVTPITAGGNNGVVPPWLQPQGAVGGAVPGNLVPLPGPTGPQVNPPLPPTTPVYTPQPVTGDPNLVPLPGVTD